MFRFSGETSASVFTWEMCGHFSPPLYTTTSTCLLHHRPSLMASKSVLSHPHQTRGALCCRKTLPLRRRPNHLKNFPPSPLPPLHPAATTTPPTAGMPGELVTQPVHHELSECLHRLHSWNLMDLHNRGIDTLSMNCNWRISLVFNRTKGNCICSTTGMSTTLTPRTAHLALHNNGHVKNRFKSGT